MPIAAAIQMNSGADIDANLHIAASLIRQAANQNAVLVTLPEMFCLMGVPASEKLAAKESFGQGKIQDFLANQAQQYGIWIIGGTLPLATNHPNKIAASCLVFNNVGNCVARYDKIHLFDVCIDSKETYRESDYTEPGKTLTVIDTPIGKVGLSVCFDLRFAELYQALAQQGAQIFCVPAAFTVPTGQAHWEILLRARAIENFCYVIGAAEFGIHPDGRSTYGHSMIIDPWGTVLQELSNSQNGVLLADIDLNFLQKTRQKISMQRTIS